MSHRDRRRMIERVLHLKRARPVISEATCPHPGWQWFNYVGGPQYQVCVRCGMPRSKLFPRFSRG